jgi:hypothetical protein
VVKTDMVKLVLETLGVKAAGQNASAEDTAQATTHLDSLYERLVGDRLAVFELTDIPSWAVSPLATMVAYELCPIYGVTGDRLVDLTNRYEPSRQELARQAASKKPRIQVKATYF